MARKACQLKQTPASDSSSSSGRSDILTKPVPVKYLATRPEAESTNRCAVQTQGWEPRSCVPVTDLKPITALPFRLPVDASPSCCADRPSTSCRRRCIQPAGTRASDYTRTESAAGEKVTVFSACVHGFCSTIRTGGGKGASSHKHQPLTRHHHLAGLTFSQSLCLPKILPPDPKPKSINIGAEQIQGWEPRTLCACACAGNLSLPGLSGCRWMHPPPAAQTGHPLPAGSTISGWHASI